MMHGHEDFRFVAVESMGIVKSYSPRTVAGDVQTMIEVRDIWRNNVTLCYSCKHID